MIARTDWGALFRADNGNNGNNGTARRPEACGAGRAVPSGAQPTYNGNNGTALADRGRAAKPKGFPGLEGCPTYNGNNGNIAPAGEVIEEEKGADLSYTISSSTSVQKYIYIYNNNTLHTTNDNPSTDPPSLGTPSRLHAIVARHENVAIVEPERSELEVGSRLQSASLPDGLAGSVPEWVADHAYSEPDAEHPQSIPQDEMVTGLLAGFRNRPEPPPSSLCHPRWRTDAGHPEPDDLCSACGGSAWATDGENWWCYQCEPLPPPDPEWRQAQIRDELRDEAAGMLGPERAAVWLATVDLGEFASLDDGGLAFANALADHALMLGELEVRRQAEEAEREKLARKALQKFGTRERADLWLRTVADPAGFKTDG